MQNLSKNSVSKSKLFSSNLLAGLLLASLSLTPGSTTSAQISDNLPSRTVGAVIAASLCAFAAYGYTLSQSDLNARTRQLIDAARTGDLEQASALLAQGIDVNRECWIMESRVYSTALIEAVDYGRLEMVRWLLEHGADANQAVSFLYLMPLPTRLAASLLRQRNNFLNRPLDYALGVNKIYDNETRVAIIELLLAHGADVNTQDIYGETALCYAIGGGYTDQIRALIKAGADVNLADKSGVTPLHRAIRRANATIIELLLQAGAKIDVLDNYGNSPLGEALHAFYAGFFHMLIKAGADVNLKNRLGRTELFDSVRYGSYARVRLLLAAGADPNLMDNDNYTALDCALKQHNRGMVELLLSAGAEVPEHLQAHPILADHTSIYRTPAFIRALTSPWPKQAARVTTPTEITKYLGTLWTNGINDYIGDPKNQTTLLMLVAELGTSPETPAIIEQLVRAGAKLNARDQHGRTALHRTFTIVQQHLRQQICPAPKDKVGDESPSYEIVHTYRSDELTTQIAAKLIELGIDINIKDYGTEPGWASEMATGAIVDAIDRRTALEYITGFPTQAYALLYRAEQAAAQANATKHAAFKCKIGDLKIS